MLYSHQFVLHDYSVEIANTARRRLFRALMLPFEVLHRQRWSAPWQ